MEEWKDIKDYEGLYQVSNYGNVKNTKTGNIIKPFKNNVGYLLNLLCKNGKRNNIRVHRLVAEAFIPNPDNKPEVNHKDGDKENNNVNNLEWCTKSYNIKYSYDKGLRKSCAKTTYQFDLQNNFIKKWNSTLEAEKELGISNSCISSCCNGRYKTAGGFIWRYEQGDTDG